MKRYRLVTVLFATLVASVAFRPVLAGEEKTAFKADRKQGDRTTIETATRLDLLLFHPGAKEDEGVSMVLERRTKEAHRVLDAIEGRARSVEVAVEEAVETRTSPVHAGKTEKPLWARGKTFEVSLAEGKATIRVLPPEGPDPELPEDLRGRLAREVQGSILELMPSDPVSPGFEWTRSGKELVRLLGDPPAGTFREGKALFRFKELEGTGASRVAIVEIASLSVRIHRGEGSSRLRLLGQGELRIALDSGLPVSLKLDGKADLEGDPGNVKGVGTFSVKREIRPVGK